MPATTRGCAARDARARCEADGWLNSEQSGCTELKPTPLELTIFEITHPYGLPISLHASLSFPADELLEQRRHHRRGEERLRRRELLRA